MNITFESSTKIEDINFGFQSVYWNKGRDCEPSLPNVQNALKLLKNISDLQDEGLRLKVLTAIRKFNKDNRNRYPTPEEESGPLMLDIFLRWVITEDLVNDFLQLGLVEQPDLRNKRLKDNFFQYRYLFSLAEDTNSLTAIIERGEELVSEWNTKGLTYIEA